MLRLRILSAYIGREFVLSFLVSFLFFFVIFFINVLLVMADDILSKQVPILDVLALITFALPQILALAVPFGTLLGALLALGRLSSDFELTAMQASGIRLVSAFVPLAAIGLALSALSFVTSDLLLPASTIQFNNVYRRILYTNPALELEPFSVKRFQETSIVTGALEEGVLHDITIIDRGGGAERRVITAQTARLAESASQAGIISLTLDEVFTHVSHDGEPGNFEYSSSEQMIYNIVLQDITVSLASLGPREKSSVDVWREIGEQRVDLEGQFTRLAEARSAGAFAIQEQLHTHVGRVRATSGEGRTDSLAQAREELASQLSDTRRRGERPPSDRTLRNHLFEFHKKFSVPLACLVFVVFAFPAGLLAPRSGRAYGLLLGLGVAAVYWVLLFFGQTTGLRLRYSPALTMWFPNLVVLVAGGVVLLVRRSR